MKALTEQIVTYRLIILYGLLFTANSLCSSIILSFLNIEWNDLSATSKFLVIVGTLQGWTGTILAFVNRTVSRIENHEPILQAGDMLAATTAATTTTIKKP